MTSAIASSHGSQPAEVFDNDSDVEEGDGDEHTHFFPLLPSSFSHQLTLTHWHPILLPTSAGRLLLTRDAAFPGQRCVELQCEAGKVDGVGMVYPADDEYIGTSLPIINLHIKNVLCSFPYSRLRRLYALVRPSPIACCVVRLSYC